jgi:hypothetical protein
MQLRSFLLAALRVLWAAVPFVAGPALASMLDGRSGAVRVASGAMLWTGWVVALLAMLVPATVSLTAMRIIVAAGAVAVIGATISDPTPLAAVALMVIAGAAAVAFAPETGIRFVNGAAYPNERRFPLRIPAPLLFGPLPIAWAAAVGGPVAGVLLLAAKQWIAGGIASVVGVAVAVVLARAIHGLARRWLVFVPAGIVLHDPMTLTDPVLMGTPAIASFDAATVEGAETATDLTQRAMGMALELRMREPATLSLVRPGRRTTENLSVGALLVTPTRPGAVLAEAERRQIRRLATPPPTTSPPSAPS